jgi:hypothetical protein
MTGDDLDLMCVRVVELVTDYMLDLLSAEEQAAIERHLIVCPGCDAFFSQMRVSVRWSAALRGQAEAGTPPESLVELYRKWKAGKPEPEPK